LTVTRSASTAGFVVIHPGALGSGQDAVRVDQRLLDRARRQPFGVELRLEGRSPLFDHVPWCPKSPISRALTTFASSGVDTRLGLRGQV
jgi:hypothetical protein